MQKSSVAAPGKKHTELICITAGASFAAGVALTYLILQLHSDQESKPVAAIEPVKSVLKKDVDSSSTNSILFTPVTATDTNIPVESIPSSNDTNPVCVDPKSILRINDMVLVKSLVRASPQMAVIEYQSNRQHYQLGEFIFSSHWNVSSIRRDQVMISDGENQLRLSIGTRPEIKRPPKSPATVVYTGGSTTRKSQTVLQEEREFELMDQQQEAAQAEESGKTKVSETTQTFPYAEGDLDEQ